MRDGSIVLMGGYDGGYKNDVWRFMPAGSKETDPLHTYTMPGTYQVALKVSNPTGNNSTWKAGYTVTSSKTKIGVVRNNKTWLLNASGNGTWGLGDTT